MRVIAPDVGGGFGYKGILLPEEVALSLGTRKLGRPLRWLEDRRENLTAGADCREHHYVLTAYADEAGRLLALDCDATVDAGAYSAYPFSACLEAGQIGSILPGLYDFPHYRCRTYSVATNKPPILPYRGVARTGVCFALEVTLDALARELRQEPTDLRFKSLVRPEQMPFDNIAKRHFDCGDYPEALRRCRGRRRSFGGARKAKARRTRRAPARRSGSPCIPSRPATGPASMRVGASRSSRASSNARRASRPMAAWSCASARTATARDMRRRCRRSPMTSSACRMSGSSSCTATRPRPLTRPAPGARVA